MDVHVKQGFIEDEATDAIVVNLFEGVKTPGGALKAVDEALDGLIGQLIAEGDFSGKLGETHLLYTQGALPARRILIAGLGPREGFTPERARQAAAAAARRVRKLNLDQFSTIVHGAGAGGLDAGRAAQAVIEGSLLGLYRFVAHKRDRKPDEKSISLTAITMVEADPASLDAVTQGARTGLVLAEMTNFARDLMNEPANVLTPRVLADRIQTQATETGLSCQVLGEADMEALGAGSFLGIAQGSDEEGQFIVLEHEPAGHKLENLPTVVLVGKAITFDSGGISLKPTKNLWKMKDDMGGGAAVAGALLAAARLNLPVHAVGLIPATENMPGARAIKPGDIVKAMNGKTVEIISTDAEGRQVLADALCYANRYNPDAVVDVATLTGTIGRALGKEIAGLFCDDAGLRDRLMAAGDLAGELLWPMPVHKPYRRLIDSEVADMKNSGGPFGGAINAALFLNEFAEGYPWAHLDIAGVAWRDESSPYAHKGGAGFSTRLLVELLRGYAA